MDSDGVGLVGERGPAGERGTGPTGDASRMAWMLAIGHWWRGLIGLQYATRQEQSRRMNRRRHGDNSRVDGSGLSPLGAVLGGRRPPCCSCLTLKSHTRLLLVALHHDVARRLVLVRTMLLVLLVLLVRAAAR
jgi:hypothetical protein